MGPGFGAVAQVCFIKKKCKGLVFLYRVFSKHDKLGRISSLRVGEMTHQLRKNSSCRGSKLDSQHPPVTRVPGDTVSLQASTVTCTCPHTSMCIMKNKTTNDFSFFVWIYSFILRFTFHYVCVYVNMCHMYACFCEHVPHICRCPGKPDAGVSSPGAGITGGYELSNGSCRRATHLTIEPSLQLCIFIF